MHNYMMQGIASPFFIGLLLLSCGSAFGYYESNQVKIDNTTLFKIDSKHTHNYATTTSCSVIIKIRKSKIDSTHAHTHTQ